MLKQIQKRRLEGLKALLRPVAHYCISHSLTLQDLFQAAKETLVEAAVDEMKRKEETINTSRIAVMSGVHRRDVMRIYDSGEVFEASISLGARVLAQWESDRRFRTRTGEPRELSLGGEDSEFKKLVISVSKEINPGTVLFELERGGFVERTETGVRLRNISHVAKDLAEGYKLLARDNEDMCAAVVENLETPPEILNLHARTEFDNLYQEDLPSIRKWILEEGTAFHRKLRDFLSQHDKDINPQTGKKGGGKAIICAYSRTINGDGE